MTAAVGAANHFFNRNVVVPCDTKNRKDAHSKRFHSHKARRTQNIRADSFLSLHGYYITLCHSASITLFELNPCRTLNSAADFNPVMLMLTHFLSLNAQSINLSIRLAARSPEVRPARNHRKRRLGSFISCQLQAKRRLRRRPAAPSWLTCSLGARSRIFLRCQPSAASLPLSRAKSTGISWSHHCV